MCLCTIHTTHKKQSLEHASSFSKVAKQTGRESGAAEGSREKVFLRLDFVYQRKTKKTEGKTNRQLKTESKSKTVK